MGYRRMLSSPGAAAVRQQQQPQPRRRIIIVGAFVEILGPRPALVRNVLVLLGESHGLHDIGRVRSGFFSCIGDEVFDEGMVGPVFDGHVELHRRNQRHR